MFFRTFELWFYVAYMYHQKKESELTYGDRKTRSRTLSEGGGITFFQHVGMYLNHKFGTTAFFLLVYFVVSLFAFIDVNGYAGRMGLQFILTVQYLRYAILIIIFLVVLEQWVEMLKIYKVPKFAKLEAFFSFMLMRVMPSVRRGRNNSSFFVFVFDNHT
jgi:hypothetical protein